MGADLTRHRETAARIHGTDGHCARIVDALQRGELYCGLEVKMLGIDTMNVLFGSRGM